MIPESEASKGAFASSQSSPFLTICSAKGFLIGNGYRLKELEAPERSEQFTEKAIKRATGFEYCLLPTSELFKAVCAELKNPEDGALKKRIWASLLSKVGVWKFEVDVGASESAAVTSN